MKGYETAQMEAYQIGCKETAKKVLDDIFAPYNEIGGGLYELTPNDKKILCKKYGVKVEK